MFDSAYLRDGFVPISLPQITPGAGRMEGLVVVVLILRRIFPDVLRYLAIRVKLEDVLSVALVTYVTGLDIVVRVLVVAE